MTQSEMKKIVLSLLNELPETIKEISDSTGVNESILKKLTPGRQTVDKTNFASIEKLYFCAIKQPKETTEIVDKNIAEDIGEELINTDFADSYTIHEYEADDSLSIITIKFPYYVSDADINNSVIEVVNSYKDEEFRKIMHKVSEEDFEAFKGLVDK